VGIPDAASLSDLAALSALDEPTRRRLYTVVVEAGCPVGRDEAAERVGVGRSLAAYHLDKLAEQGLLEVEYARPPGRSGPGGGRPAKLYRRALREFVLRAPPRDYYLLAEFLVRAAAADVDGVVQAAIERAAIGLGESLGKAGGSLEEILRDRGYEPVLAEPGLLRLRNCPFDAVATRCPEVVCRVNLALIRGILTGLGGDPSLAALAPREHNCCVAVRLARAAADREACR
jgi:predicted ArsR family transcriptional regulator